MISGQSGIPSFERLLLECGVIDTRYPSKGTLVWMPYGMHILHTFLGLVRGLLQQFGFEEYLFPNLAAKAEFDRVTDKVADFSDNTIFVTENEVLRASGECLVYPMLRLWIKSHHQLPLRLYQVTSNFRPKRDQGGLFRTHETFPFIEGYTAHPDLEDAEEQFDADVRLLNELARLVGVPCHTSDRLISQKHRTSERTVSLDAVLPLGKCLMVGNAYLQGHVFSKAFGVRYTSRTNSTEFSCHTSLGFSSRLLFTSLLLHADDIGLRVFPSVAPFHVVILPITDRSTRSVILTYADRVRDSLIRSGLRVAMDDSVTRLGDKFQKYEKMGIPLRCEIGPSELSAKKIKVVCRDTGASVLVSDSEVEAVCSEQLSGISRRMSQEAERNLHKNTACADSLDNATLGGEIAARKLFLCSSPGCLQEATRILSAEALGYQPTTELGKCVVCGKQSQSICLLARRL